MPFFLYFTPMKRPRRFSTISVRFLEWNYSREKIILYDPKLWKVQLTFDPTLHVRLPGSYISMLPSEHLCLFRAACFKAFTYLWVTLYGCWCQRQTPLSLDLSLVFREKCGLKRLFLPIISKSYYFDLPQRTTKSRRLRFSLQISLSVHLIAKSLSLRGALVFPTFQPPEDTFRNVCGFFNSKCCLKALFKALRNDLGRWNFG